MNISGFEEQTGAAEINSEVDGIAIIGMAGRFPGARNIAEFWQNLREGLSTIRFLSDQELLEDGLDPAVLALPNYVKARGSLGDAEYFDAAFFGHSPKVAEVLDPQHRLFLECSWHALEDAGYDPGRYPGRIGVYAGSSMNTYLLNNLYSRLKMVASVDSLQVSIGNDKDSLTTEVSYKLNLKGPAVTIQTSSSTSLSAVHYACQALLSYECDMALAGGVSIHFPEKAGYLFQEGGATSRDGYCRPFDARAEGFVNGHGAGVVVLKRLQEALADRDTITAVIKGTAVNNDGSLKVSYMAPSVEGQAQVIMLAQAIANVSADTIGYVEAHGTGTVLGDPIEFTALNQAFRATTEAKQYCALGSVKPNIGHLDAAAGVAGLIKAALALKHGQIPASLNYQSPNPQIDFENSPFFVNTELRDWPAGGPAPRRAGVSSFGMGGTNAHVVLEEAPDIPAESESGESNHSQLLLLSAKTQTALQTATANLAQFLKTGRANLELADIAYTLQMGRQPFNFRRALIAADLDEAVEILESGDQRLLNGVTEPAERPVVFMFSGQGSQYVGMGADLYQSEPLFRQAVDRCAGLLQPLLGLDLRELLYPADPSLIPELTGQLNQTALTQPALFTIEYALAQLWLSRGIRPAAMIGHSLGEYVAATVAGVFSLEDALEVVARRGRLMQELPTGAMLAVPLAEADLRPLLDNRAELSLAALNGPEMSVISGPGGAVEELQQLLAERGVAGRILHTSHAFHSAMMDPALAPFRAILAGVRLQAPQIPYISNLTGRWITDQEATSLDYWTAHLRQPVRFSAGLEALLEEAAVLVEIGPGQALSTFARQHPRRHPPHLVVPSLRHPLDNQNDQAFLLSSLGKLWLAGVEPDWEALHPFKPRRVALPLYPFERQPYIVKPDPLAGLNRYSAASARPVKQAKVNQWFYLPGWKPALPVTSGTVRASGPGPWLVLADQDGVAESLLGQIEQSGEAAVVVRPGPGYAQLSEKRYQVNPGRPEDYRNLVEALAAGGQIPPAVLLAWSLDQTDQRWPGQSESDSGLETSFFSLLYLSQAFQTRRGPLQITILTQTALAVAGESQLNPLQATLLGLAKVLPQEYGQFSCQLIDLALPPAGSWQFKRLISQLGLEITQDRLEPLLAYRDNRRWLPAYEPQALPPGNLAPAHELLRPNGVYLITGGLGNIGLPVARFLAQNYQARLLLAGRSWLPPTSEWPDWLASHAADDAISLKLHQVQEIERLGGQVRLYQLDAANPVQLQQALEDGQRSFGNLNGVFHLAGAVGNELFQPSGELTQADCLNQFQAKIGGTLALEKVLQNRELDFVVLFSSLAAVLGGLGMSAYSAANNFMDSFAARQSKQNPTPWISLGWDAWNLDETAGYKVAGTLKELALTPAEGLEALRMAMTLGPLPHILISTADLSLRVAQWIKPGGGAESDRPGEAASAVVDPGEYYARPALQTSYVAPRTPLEQSLAQLWSQLLKIDQVGIYDSFFELGGNSLTGIQLMNQLKQDMGVQLSAAALYEGPTIQTLAHLIEQDGQEDSDEYAQNRSRGERRRARKQSRVQS
jgi:acyl transferase domain-containing protein